MIKVEQVTKNFADVRSLDCVSATIQDGSIFGLIGSNGSGKSTLLRVMAGVIAPDSGTVLHDGWNVWENTIAKNKIVYLSDEPYFLPHASLNDMRFMYKNIYPSFRDDKFRSLAEMFGLDTNRKIQTFSKGMQKQAAVLLALSAQPKYDILIILVRF